MGDKVVKVLLAPPGADRTTSAKVDQPQPELKPDLTQTDLPLFPESPQEPTETEEKKEDVILDLPEKGRKSKRNKEEKILTKRELRLQRVMKPLVDKCIPPKDPPPPKTTLYKAPSRIAPRNPIQKKDEVIRKISNLIFTMPKVRDPVETQRLRTEKMVQKLIKYMKKSWKISVDARQEERELVYRTVQSVITRKPDNWEELIKRREHVSIETGFFCGFDGPYANLINLELDTPMLVFNNLPPDLKISATRWIRNRERKEELKRKQNAYLPRLPNNQLKRPNFARGKLLKDPGGLKLIDGFVQVAEDFQKWCKGSSSYAKVLNDWAQKKEKDDENVNYGFGTVPTNFRYGFTSTRPQDEDYLAPEIEDPDIKAATAASKAEDDRFAAMDRRDSMVDGRKYQREMLEMEYKISALYLILKSILSIKVKQLNSNLPLPMEVVMQLRDTSPEPKERKKVQPPKQIFKRAKRHPLIYTALPTPAPSMYSYEMGEEEEDDDCIDLEIIGSDGEMSKVTMDEGTRSLWSRRTLRSSHRVVDEVKRVHSLQEKMAKKNKKLSAQEKIKQLQEQPEHAALRLARNAATYGRLFERHQKMKPPIWHSVQVEQFRILAATKGAKDPTNLTSADGEEIVDMAIRKRQQLSSSRRWPDVDDIPTPNFPFSVSPRKVPSEEKSRRNLLSMMPNKDQIPSTPVRRLFKLAGVRTTDKQTFNVLWDMKRQFRATEKKVRIYYQNEIGKMEFDTMRRYRAKLNAIFSDPVYQWSIGAMRQATKVYANDDDEDMMTRVDAVGGVRRQALWFRKLLEECGLVGASRHNGCQLALERLLKYCDIDLKSKSNLLSRLALLVVSLPTTELGARHWQHAILFLLENLFEAPQEVLVEWLNYRNLHLLIS